jgi:uncharacterized protein
MPVRPTRDGTRLSKETIVASAVNWFDIPVADIGRAAKFYETILGIRLDVQDSPSGKTAMFPADWQNGEVGGSISQGEGLTPSATGSLIYLNANPDLKPVLDRVEGAGGRVVLPKTAIPMDAGHMAIFIDTEGNKVGLHSMG